MTDILSRLADLREHPRTAELREHNRRGYGFVAHGSSRTWTLSDEEVNAINVGFEAADNRTCSLIALVQEAAKEIERLRVALTTFDESMRNGSIGPAAKKMKEKALKAAHKKALRALKVFT